MIMSYYSASMCLRAPGRSYHGSLIFLKVSSQVPPIIKRKLLETGHRLVGIIASFRVIFFANLHLFWHTSMYQVHVFVEHQLLFFEYIL